MTRVEDPEVRVAGFSHPPFATKKKRNPAGSIALFFPVGVSEQATIL